LEAVAIALGGSTLLYLGLQVQHADPEKGNEISPNLAYDREVIILLLGYTPRPWQGKVMRPPGSKLKMSNRNSIDRRHHTLLFSGMSRTLSGILVPLLWQATGIGQ